MKVGILGCGQLARMLTLAAQPLGIETISLIAKKDAETNGVTPVFVGDYSNEQDIEAFARQVDVITFETENIPVEVAKKAEIFAKVHPSVTVLTIAQDRFYEKELFTKLGITTTRYRLVNSLDELKKAAQDIGLPAVLKVRRFGYDGKGQFILRDNSELEKAWHTVTAEYPNKELESYILETFIPFDSEVSMIAVRGENQDIAYYPLTENRHQQGILYLSKAPLANLELQKQAETVVEKILLEMHYVGVLAVEFFQRGNELIANEMAPRVHNTGHWTIEGADTSQFENHLRAILALPIGNTEAVGYSAMVNCIGTMPAPHLVLKFPHVHYHDYHKTPRLNRKLGHVTLHTTDKEQYQYLLDKLTQFIKINRDYRDQHELI